MAIWLDENSKIIVQGMTGSEGTKHTRRMVASGTNVVAGVTPGKGGQEVDGIPVFNSVAEAVAATGANVSVVFVPPKFAKGAVIEAVDARVPLCVVITEGIPVHDTASFFQYAQNAGTTRVVGPNCPGLISPGKSNAGIIPADITKAGATKVTDLKAILPRIDYVSIHCPRMPETINMFNKETLALMKPTAFLVNTARGGIVNEDALYAALSSGKLRGAGLDVLDREPPDPNNKLFTLENVILSPHMAGVTQEASDRMAVTAIENILSVFDGRTIAANVVNKEVLG